MEEDARRVRGGGGVVVVGLEIIYVCYLLVESGCREVLLQFRILGTSSLWKREKTPLESFNRRLAEMFHFRCF